MAISESDISSSERGPKKDKRRNKYKRGTSYTRPNFRGGRGIPVYNNRETWRTREQHLERGNPRLASYVVIHLILTCHTGWSYVSPTNRECTGSERTLTSDTGSFFVSPNPGNAFGNPQASMTPPTPPSHATRFFRGRRDGAKGPRQMGLPTTQTLVIQTTDSLQIINLSNTTLTQDEINLLKKGFTFTPTPTFKSIFMGERHQSFCSETSSLNFIEIKLLILDNCSLEMRHWSKC